MSALPSFIPTYAGYVESYLQYLAMLNHSPRTIASYRSDYAELLQFCPTPLTVDGAERYLEFLVGRGLSPSTVQRRVAASSGMYEYLLRKGLVQVNPFRGLRLPKREQRLPEALDKAVILRCLEGLPATPLGWRDRALISLLFGGGGRITEIVGLTTKQLDIEKREVRVVGKGNKERIIAFSPTAAKDLASYLRESRPNLLREATDAVFLNEHGAPFTRFGAAQMVARRFAVLGVHVHPHQLRHSFGQSLIESGADIRLIAEAMGHASVVTTQRYTMTSVKRIHDAVAHGLG